MKFQIFCHYCMEWVDDFVVIEPKYGTEEKYTWIACKACKTGLVRVEKE